MSTTINLPEAKNYEDCIKAAHRASLDHPGCYITVKVIFHEARLTVAKRLHTQDPSWADLGCYWLNGKRKNFTTAQRIADQQAGHLH